MARQRKLFITHAGALAHHLVRAVRPHAMIADFAKSYARQHGRTGVVDEPGRVRELESTLGREAILVMVAEVHRLLPATLGARKGRPLEPEEAAFAQMFWPEFMAALGRMLEWAPDEAASEREALDRDLLMYRRWSERAPFPGAPVPQDGISPFLDRCALLLDPSTMEEARQAAAGFEKELVHAAARIIGQLGRTGDEEPRPKKNRRRPPRANTPAAKKSRPARPSKKAARKSKPKRRPRR
jgi:hypothetical protein